MTAGPPPPPRDGEVCGATQLTEMCECGHERGRHSDETYYRSHDLFCRCRVFRPAAPHEPPAADSPTPGTERRAPVQSDREHPNGSVAWWEHEQAWQDYHRRYPSQDAETIAKRAGFSYAELVDHLGHAPTTWQVGTTRYVPPAAPSPVDTAEPPAETQQDDDPTESSRGLARQLLNGVLTVHEMARTIDAALAARPSIDPKRAEQVLDAHHRRDIGSCHCGTWGVDHGDLGRSHTVHVVEELMKALDAR